MAVFRVMDRGLQHVAQAHRTVVAQEQHPGVEGARDHGGKEAVAGDEREAFAPVMLDGGAAGRHALAAQHLDPFRARGIEHRRHVARGADEMGLHHLEHEGGGHAGVEGVAAALQHRHADRGAEPVGRGHDPEGAENFRARGKHAGSWSRGARL
jgi:hypothetical protein